MQMDKHTCNLRKLLHATHMCTYTHKYTHTNTGPKLLIIDAGTSFTPGSFVILGLSALL